MDRAEFIQGLRALGFVVEEGADNFVTFPWEIPVGPRATEHIRLGLQVPRDVEETPPSGPHVSPHLFPLNQGNPATHPSGAIHASTLGEDWQYWSRPFPNPPGWASTDRSARAYMRHINHLFDTL
jgi:hypothetical protein